MTFEDDRTILCECRRELEEMTDEDEKKMFMDNLLQYWRRGTRFRCKNNEGNSGIGGDVE